MSSPIRILHIITDMDTGGAEVMLYRLLSALDRQQFDPLVISLTGDGPFGENLRKAGIPVRLLKMDARAPNPFLLLKLLRWLQETHPHVIQTWMYHADLLGGLAGFLTRTPVVWGIHNTSLDPLAVKRNTIRIVHLNARLSGWLPRQIVSCSETARGAHVNIGYFPDKFVVIPNGFDLNLFCPDQHARKSLLQELGLPADTFLIGLVARFDPLKEPYSWVTPRRS